MLPVLEGSGQRDRLQVGPCGQASTQGYSVDGPRTGGEPNDTWAKHRPRNRDDYAPREPTLLLVVVAFPGHQAAEKKKDEYQKTAFVKFHPDGFDFQRQAPPDKKLNSWSILRGERAVSLP